jgi:ribosomal protein S18 acetylase RimI-like enzyme
MSRTIEIRAAQAADIPAIRAMQERSMRVLGGKHYAPDSIAAFVEQFGTMDFAVVGEGHFLVATDQHGGLLGSGGWSRLAPGYQRGSGAASPPRDIATVRGVFVDPAAARNGIGAAIMRHAEADAAKHGISMLRLTATLSGVDLYQALGYRETARRAIELRDGLRFGCVDMEKPLEKRAASQPGSEFLASQS